jgi:hypothetical protein
MELETGSPSMGVGRSRGRRRASDGDPHAAHGAYGHETGWDALAPRIEAYPSRHVGKHVDEAVGPDDVAGHS